MDLSPSSSANETSSRRQQKLATKKKRRIVVRTVVFFFVFTSCYHYEINKINHLITKVSESPSDPSSIHAPEASKSTAATADAKLYKRSRSVQEQQQSNRLLEWKHIRPITNDNDDSSFVRISFQLHVPSTHAINHTFNQYMKCDLGNVTEGKNKNVFTGEVRTDVVPDALMRSSKGRILDFTTTISTSLHLLSIGDSVTIQYSYTLDEIIGGASLSSRTVLWESWPGHVGGSVVYPTNGGGAHATWRMTGLLSRNGEGLPAANKARRVGQSEGGWSSKHVKRFLNREQYGVEMVRMKEMAEARIRLKQNRKKFNNVAPSEDLSKLQHNPKISKFDVVIFRTMHGWMKTDKLTPNRFLEAMQLATELFGAETVILQTIPFTNNVKTEDDWETINRINQIMRNMAKSWHGRQDSTSMPKTVLVQEYGQYVNHIIWSNARYLGYNVSDPVNAHHDVFMREGPTFLFDRLNDGKEYPPSIPMVCSDMESLGDKRDKCNRNYLFSDGMHVCPERLSFRYASSLACLIGCVYNQFEPNGRDLDLRDCEQECNDLFMSVVPVYNGWVDGAVTLASFA